MPSRYHKTTIPPQHRNTTRPLHHIKGGHNTLQRTGWKDRGQERRQDRRHEKGRTEDRKGDREGNKTEDRTEETTGQKTGQRTYTTIPLHHYTTYV